MIYLRSQVALYVRPLQAWTIPDRADRSGRTHVGEDVGSQKSYLEYRQDYDYSVRVEQYQTNATILKMSCI
jgi:hypothetical protein